MVRRTICLARQVVDNLGNDVPCPLNDNSVTGAHAQSLDFVTIMQCHIGHDYAAHGDGCKPPYRRQLARASHLDIDQL